MVQYQQFHMIQPNTFSRPSQLSPLLSSSQILGYLVPHHLPPGSWPWLLTRLPTPACSGLFPAHLAQYENSVPWCLQDTPQNPQSSFPGSLRPNLTCFCNLTLYSSFHLEPSVEGALRPPHPEIPKPGYTSESQGELLLHQPVNQSISLALHSFTHGFTMPSTLKKLF